MGTFTYFAYGSNMLTERLTAPKRCPSARPIGKARAPKRKLVFEKRSTDGSGKATLIVDSTLDQHGVLFEIDDREMGELDSAEGQGKGYDRIDDFEVVCPDGRIVRAITYLATDPEEGLAPYDWYLALVVAGARQHGLPDEQIAELASTEFSEEYSTQQAVRGRSDAMQALASAGFVSLADVLRHNTTNTPSS
ncbi:MAG: gamma-glutamylcyclotransferase [Rhizobiaceae bacterium]|nr:gamma-glutamylcyclotransferase [Rhizobiaceae bacterium]